MAREFSHEKGRRQLLGFVHYFTGFKGAAGTRIVLVSDQYRSPFIGGIVSPLNGSIIYYDAILRVERRGQRDLFCFVESKYAATQASKTKLGGHFETFVVRVCLTLPALQSQPVDSLFLFVTNDIFESGMRFVDKGDVKFVRGACWRHLQSLRVPEQTIAQVAARVKVVLFPNWLQALLS
ncbi:MAG: hypothetical protein NZT92_16265 [Abditibacteriales bacterium]|nr:hypothetical protein [Abditibacteriales bacterium]MDW8367476.1 hypothetical protein [Abditibacteriales bacterium]